jgi:hypothetical protein
MRENDLSFQNQSYDLLGTNKALCYLNSLDTVIPLGKLILISCEKSFGLLSKAVFFHWSIAIIPSEFARLPAQNDILASI